ncbi:MAG: hypothetical protein QXZ17_07560 [Nitrososphaerota archaeon]
MAYGGSVISVVRKNFFIDNYDLTVLVPLVFISFVVLGIPIFKMFYESLFDETTQSDLSSDLFDSLNLDFHNRVNIPFITISFGDERIFGVLKGISKDVLELSANNETYFINWEKIVYFSIS